MDYAAFFAAIRPHMRRGRLTSAQVQGMEALIKQGVAMAQPLSFIAYVLATADHETGQRMVPVREGFCKTNAGSIKAVTKLYNKGIIRTNYALPQKPYGHSYYGRGLVQLTWKNNYLKTGKRLGYDLVKDPDLMLDLDISVEAIWDGMIFGTYRKHKLADKLPQTVKPTLKQFISARNIINGDTRKNGYRIAVRARHYYDALRKGTE